MEKRKSITSWLVPVIVSLLTFWLQHTGLLQGFETMTLDTFQLLRSSPKPSFPPDLRIVDITEEFQKNDLRGQYPLQPEGVKKLLTAIVQGRPKIVGVDLVTSSWSADDRRSVHDDRVPIVWARDAIVDEHHRLCSQDDGFGTNDVNTGIAAFPKDEDGVVRRYRRFFDVFRFCESSRPDLETLPSLPMAVVARSRADKPALDARAQSEVVLNFFGDQYPIQTIPAGIVMDASTGPDWQSRGALTGKIVLLGGSFHFAHDEHATPIGTLSGVRIVAQAIETELHGGGFHTTNEVAMYCLEFSIGLILVGLNRLPLVARAPLVISAIVFVALAFLSSYWVFSSLALWPNFIPILFAVMIHEVFHQTEQNRELREELGKLKHPAAAGVKVEQPVPQLKQP